MHPEENPRYMSDAGRIQYAIDLMEDAFSALCYLGTGPAPGDIYVGRAGRTPRVQKAIDRLDKAISALEKEQGK